MSKETVPKNEQFYILGLPIKTKLGDCHFIQIKDYSEFFAEIQIVSLTKEEIVEKYTEISKEHDITELLAEMRQTSLFGIAKGIPEITSAYKKLFGKMFREEDIFSTIESETEFIEYRRLVMRMNVMQEAVINPNPEIQKVIERSRRVKSMSGERLEFADMVTSIVGVNGFTYAEVNEFTIYQMYMTFYRIGQIKSYDTTTLFATVASDKIDIESWSKHINLFPDESHFVTQDEFQKHTASVINE